MAIGLNEEEYLNKLRKQNPDLILDDVTYVNARTAITVKCSKCDNTWYPKAGVLIGKSATGCPVCSLRIRRRPNLYTAETWWDKIISIRGSGYTCDLSTYKDQNTPLVVTCKEHGDFVTTPTKLLHTNGCVKCTKKTAGYAGSVTTDTVIKRVNDLYDNMYLTDDVVYVNQQTPIKLVCKTHGPFTAIPKRLFKGYGCIACRKTLKDHTTVFINRAKKVHGDYYIYDKVSCDSGSGYVDIECREHGIFKQRMDTHLNGHGCGLCGIEGRWLTNDEFVERLKELHPKLIIDNESGYTNSGSVVKFKCPEHGYFTKIASELIRKPRPGCSGNGLGCPVCSSSLGERRVFSVLTKLKQEIKVQFKFKDSAYRYDFYLPKLNLLIEYDGYQHYFPVDHWGGVEYLKKTQANDAAKNKLAELNNIPLLRIPYTKDESLEEYLLWLLSKHYTYYKDGVFYKTFTEFAKHKQFPTNAIVRDYNKFKTINIKPNLESPVSNDTEKASS